MPWKETSAMDQRVQFIGDWLSGQYSKSELCQCYRISRPTGDKWIKRYQRWGVEGLKEWSRAAKSHPKAVDPALCERIVHYKLKHQRFGPKKVMDGLRREAPSVARPADSTGGEILKRAGLIGLRRRVPPHSQPLAHCGGANTVWSADFKGDFALGDGRRCYPLTMTDNFSRYLLQCRGLARATRTMYTLSVRPYPVKMAPIEYGSEVTVRQVRHNGKIRWQGHLIYLSEVLAKEPIGICPIDDGRWELRYSPLGVFDESTQKIRPPSQWHG